MEKNLANPRHEWQLNLLILRSQVAPRTGGGNQQIGLDPLGDLHPRRWILPGGHGQRIPADGEHQRLRATLPLHYLAGEGLQAEAGVVEAAADGPPAGDGSWGIDDLAAAMVGVGPPGPAVGGGAAQCQGLVEVAGERRRQRGGLVGGAGVALMGRYVRHIS